MDDNHHTNNQPAFVILGSGLSALNLAIEIREQFIDEQCIIIDTSSSHHGASTAPLGLLNPCTSRSPKPIDHAEIYLQNALNRYEGLRNIKDDSPILLGEGVFKPVPLGEDPLKWKRRYLNASWPDDWSEWIEIEELDQLVGIEKDIAPHGGIFIKKAWYVSLRELRLALINKAQEMGVQFIESTTFKVDQERQFIRLNALQINFSHLIYANGYQAYTDSIWKNWIQMHAIKGQMLELITDAANSSNSVMNFAITNSGYIAHVDSNHFVIGSTYEHEFSDLETDQPGLDRIKKKFKHLKPSLSEAKIQRQAQWAACRIATRDRKPLIGPHPRYKHLFLMNAMASKGLIYAPTAAKYLVNYFKTNEQKALKDWNLNRFILVS